MVALVRGSQVVRLVRLGGGKLSVGSLRSAGLDELHAFRLRHGLPFVAAVDIDALPRLWADVQTAVHLDDDLVAQQLAVVRVLQRAVAAQELLVEPRLFGGQPIPPLPVVQATFDRVLPDRRSLVFYLVDRRRIWTSLIAVKRDGDIQLVTTHRAIADEVRFTSIHHDAPRVIEAVTRRYEPVHIGAFLPLSSWHRLIRGDRSAVARAISGRRCVLEPCPPWLLALVGVGVMSEAASHSVRMAGRLLSRTGLLPGTTAERLLSSVTSPLDALGVDPWEALAWGRDWTQRIMPLFR